MKKLLFSIVLLCFGVALSAQSPNLMSYQSIIRNASNQLIVNAPIGVRVSLLQGSASGTVVFSETYNPNPTTNSNGLLGLNIGSGISIIGTFTQVNWSQGPYFVQVEADPAGGTNYSISSVSQLLSVPYALHAKTAEVPGLPGPQGPIGLTGPAGPQGAPGNDGAVGPQGPIGLTGPQGVQGAQGNSGAVGPQGPAGNDGAAGPQGPIGLTGSSGPQGPIGLTGPQGLQGVPGNDGAVGPQGPIGLTGPTGPQGVAGNSGAIGPIGLTGPTGPQGVAGNSGAIGPIGLTGPVGPQGPAGNDGAVGPQGPIGLTGPQGPAGSDGAVGPQGPIGLTGPAGPQGVQGVSGPQGPAGNDGAVGPQGPIGLTGPAGSDGAVGPQGPVGLTGPAGPQGAPGNDGAVGPQGPIGLIGPAGPQGVPGPQGPSGIEGDIGPQGPIGLTGPAGLQGVPGNDGAVGPQGPQGIQGPMGSFPSGTQPGEMNFWSGTSWVSVPPGNRGESLIFCDGIPTWGGCLPIVSTSAVINLNFGTASINSNVTSDGGRKVTARGVAYWNSPNPTLSNSFTINGTDTGQFTSVLTGLPPISTYYVRAYATNAIGTSYGNEVSFTTPVAIGTSLEGGIVFYIAPNGVNGLVCAPSDQGFYQWGCEGTNIVGTSSGIGTGQLNTNLILSGCSTRPIAASVCDNLVLNGYSDWYLPSTSELNLMYTNLRLNNLGNFQSLNGTVPGYWSSTQTSANGAFSQLFWNGAGSCCDGKSNPLYVRAVRSF